MKKALFIIFTVVLGVSMLGCETNKKTTDSVQQGVKEAQMESIKGMLTYRERMALPPEAVITVTLADVSKADAAADVIAIQEFTADGAQVPFDFELTYDANEIDERMRYSVRATINIDGKLRFTTDTIYPVITDAEKTKVINLRLVGIQ